MASKRKPVVVKDVNVIADSIANQYGVSKNGSDSTLAKLQNKTMVKSLKYKNPLNKGNPAQKSKSPTPPPLTDVISTKSNNNLQDTELEDVDTMDFGALTQMNDDEALNVPPSTFDSKSFGQYSMDFNVDDLGDLGDIESIFDTHEVDMDKIKKAAPPKPTAAAPKIGSAPKAAPLPGGAPMPAPLPGSAPMAAKAPAAPMAAPLPGGAPMAPAAPMAAPLPGGAPMAPVAPTASVVPTASVAPTAPAAPMAAPLPGGAPMAPAAPMANQVQLSEAERQNIANAKSQFASSNASAVPLLSSMPTITENIRPEEYDKSADVLYNKDGSIVDKANQAQRLNKAAKVSQFSGLQSNRNIVSTTKEEKAYLTKHAKGKVTQFSGLEQSTRKIVTADEEEQKRIADSKLVQKQKSMFKNMSKQESIMMNKRSSIKIDKNVTDAAAAAKNKFKAMEKKNTMKNVNGRKPSTKRLKSRAKTKKNVDKK